MCPLIDEDADCVALAERVPAAARARVTAELLAVTARGEAAGATAEQIALARALVLAMVARDDSVDAP